MKKWKDITSKWSLMITLLSIKSIMIDSRLKPILMNYASRILKREHFQQYMISNRKILLSFTNFQMLKTLTSFQRRLFLLILKFLLKFQNLPKLWVIIFKYSSLVDSFPTSQQQKYLSILKKRIYCLSIPTWISQDLDTDV